MEREGTGRWALGHMGFFINTIGNSDTQRIEQEAPTLIAQPTKVYLAGI